MYKHVKPHVMLSTRDVESLRLRLVAAEYLKRMGERIAEARKAKNWRQAQLARRVEELRRERDPHAASIESSTISRWETGKVEPSAQMKEYLAQALDVPVNYFLMAEPDKTVTPDPFAGNGTTTTDLEARVAKIESDVAQILKLVRKLASGRAPAKRPATAEVDQAPLVANPPKTGRKRPASR